MERTIQAVFADADGTLIEGGKLDHFPSELPAAIERVRAQGVWFNFISGRPCFEQEILRQNLLGPSLDSLPLHPNEGILYEGSRIKLSGRPDPYLSGGLDRETIDRINAFLAENALLGGLVSQANNDRYESQTGYLAPTFISEGNTDKLLLRQRFVVIKPAVEGAFPGVEVTMSADAVDIAKKGLTKSRLVLEYMNITGTSPRNIAVIGDSGNNLSMFDLIGYNLGLVVYVGTDPAQERSVRKYSCHFIPEQRGPLGTVASLEHIAQQNLKFKGNGGK